MNLTYSDYPEGLDFVAQAPSSINLFSLAHRIAKHSVPVLITGETGTGKECVAKYIHHYSNYCKGDYVAINCAAIPESMLEAILFGYEKGAFTGAVSSTAGKFEQANGGTLLLDEIGDMPLALQAKILRVLQEQEVERLGSHKKIRLNVRIIASTNKDLTGEIEAGRFRQDLFYRLSVVPIHLPPLRERTADILPLAQRFLQKYSHLSGHSEGLSTAAQTSLLQYDWPGNIRELENVVQRAIILCNGKLIEESDLGLSMHNSRAINGLLNDGYGHNDNAIPPLKGKARMAEYQYIVDLLKHYKGNKSKIAQFLGITPRALRYRLASMRQLGIDIECYS